MEHNLTYIGSRIRMLRKQEGYKSYIFAEYAGCAIPKMYDVENGIVVPDYLLLLRIAKVLGTTIDNLTSGDDIDNYKDRAMKIFNSAFNTDTTFALITGGKRYYKIMQINENRTLVKLQGQQGYFQRGHILRYSNNR